MNNLVQKVRPSCVGGLRLSLNAGAAAMALMVASSPLQAQDQDQSQADTSRGSQEIIVTAQRRDQSVLDVPAAVSAFSGENLVQLGVRSAPDIAVLVPNFRIQFERGPNSIANFTLRGVRGAALASRLNESSVAVYSNEVFLGDETSVNTTLFDIERVEVLRGPQGTVFGKNTTGGLVHFITAKPTEELSGRGSVQYGSNNQIILDGAVSGAVTNGVRVRLAGQLNRDDGPYTNRFLGAGSNGIKTELGGRDAWGLRGTIELDLSPKTMLTLIGTYSHDDSKPAPGITYGALLPGTNRAGPYQRSQLCPVSRIIRQADCISDVQAINRASLAPIGRDTGTGVSNLTDDDYGIRGRGRSITAQLTHDFDWATLTSITNYTNNSYRIAFDADAGAQIDTAVGGAAFDFIADYRNKAEQFSQELRLSGSTNGFDWVGGLFYYKDDKSNIQRTNLRSRGLSLWNTGALNTTSLAAFAQIDAHLSEQLTLSIGGRLTNEKRELDEATTFATINANGAIAIPLQDVRAGIIATGGDASTLNKDFTGKLSLTWKPDSESSYYLSFSRGIKGAGFNTGFSPASSLAQNIALAGPVGQEVLDSYEIGLKNRFGRLVSINTAAFYYDYQGKQEQVFSFDLVTSTPQQNYLNIGVVEIYGMETEIVVRPTPNLDINFSGGWLQTRVKKSSLILTDSFGARIPAQGLKLSDVPEWSFNAYVSYRIPVANIGEFTIQPEFNGVARTNFSITNEPYAVDRTHIFTNLRLLWTSPDNRFNGQVFVNNVFDELSFLNPRDTVLGSSGKFNATEGLGRLWGVQLGMTF